MFTCYLYVCVMDKSIAGHVEATNKGKGKKTDVAILQLAYWYVLIWSHIALCLYPLTNLLPDNCLVGAKAGTVAEREEASYQGD